MILRFYPTKDATIYERYPERNTGLDAILEISKVVVATGSALSGSYNSRILLNFDYTAISSSIVSLGYNPNQFSYGLKLYVAEANEIPMDYTLYAYPVSQSWEMGIGRYGNSPETKAGVSWYYRNTADDISTSWATGSFGPTSTGSWSSTKGGGTWFTSSVASQSFSYITSDIDMDITSIVRGIQSGSYTFNGVIIKKSDTDESNTNIFNSLKFFSKDTHTVYLPVIEARLDDSVSAGTLSAINVDDDINIVASNLKSTYAENSTPKIRISAGYRYPTPVFQTSSLFLTSYRLPSGSQYAIYSAHGDDVIVGFSDYTRLSDDATSNYVKLHLDSFQPERYYRMLIRVPNSGSTSTYQVYDQKWIFKVTRS